ncbi:unnamed protein product, partial [Rotaria sordida]
MAAPRAAGGRF